MGFFDRDVRNGFDRMFDFNRDGKLDMSERAMQFDYIDREMSSDFAGDSDEEMARTWDARIESLADEFNKSGVKPYSIYVSVGSVCKMPGRTDTIRSFIKESDEIMYENKMRNKAIHVR